MKREPLILRDRRHIPGMRSAFHLVIPLVILGTLPF